VIRQRGFDRRYRGAVHAEPSTGGGRPLVHVVGARPNFVKAAPVIRALAAAGIPQRVIHTGQHYDKALSGVFFSELALPEPEVNLEVGSGSHARQTAALLVALEDVLGADHAPLVVVYGDVNSTLAAALVAAKLTLPLAHVEAGLRSFDMGMPEEINRRVADALADLCFATSSDAVENLRREGVAADRIHLVGNTMIDSLEVMRPRLDPRAARRAVGVADGPYGVVTLHRPGNVDEPGRTRDLVRALAAASTHVPLVFPVHPRGRAALDVAGLAGVPEILAVEPLGYLDFLSLMAGGALVITDSGGVQEETTVLGVPCLTVRPNTERPITITDGTNRLVEPGELAAAVVDVLSGAAPGPRRPPLWDGRAGERIAAVVVAWLAGRAPAEAAR
jgi:UDP-N-acetylglucosamine 2-epimerase (non-hydrolysing)